MKCVQKVNCDFEGVITDEVFDLSPELDMLRVPLIVSIKNPIWADKFWFIFLSQPCVNRQRGNAVDVCCRDPDHEGPNSNNSRTNNKKQNNNQQQTHNKQQPTNQGSPEKTNTQAYEQNQQNPPIQETNQSNRQRGPDNNKTQKRKKSNAYG